MPTPSGSKVHVQTATIRSTVIPKFDDWADKLYESVPLLQEMKLTPGSVPYASALKQQYARYIKGDYTTALANLVTSFRHISSTLKTVMDEYDKSEHTATGDAKRLAKLLAGVKQPFEDANKPAAPTGTTPPNDEKKNNETKTDEKA